MKKNNKNLLAIGAVLIFIVLIIYQFKLIPFSILGQVLAINTVSITSNVPEIQGEYWLINYIGNQGVDSLIGHFTKEQIKSGNWGASQAVNINMYKTHPLYCTYTYYGNERFSELDYRQWKYETLPFVCDKNRAIAECNGLSGYLKDYGSCNYGCFSIKSNTFLAGQPIIAGEKAKSWEERLEISNEQGKLITATLNEANKYALLKDSLNNIFGKIEFTQISSGGEECPEPSGIVKPIYSISGNQWKFVKIEDYSAFTNKDNLYDTYVFGSTTKEQDQQYANEYNQLFSKVLYSSTTTNPNFNSVTWQSSGESQGKALVNVDSLNIFNPSFNLYLKTDYIGKIDIQNLAGKPLITVSNTEMNGVQTKTHYAQITNIGNASAKFSYKGTCDQLLINNNQQRETIEILPQNTVAVDLTLSGSASTSRKEACTITACDRVVSTLCDTKPFSVNVIKVCGLNCKGSSYQDINDVNNNGETCECLCSLTASNCNGQQPIKTTDSCYCPSSNDACQTYGCDEVSTYCSKDILQNPQCNCKITCNSGSPIKTSDGKGCYCPTCTVTTCGTGQTFDNSLCKCVNTGSGGTGSIDSTLLGIITIGLIIAIIGIAIFVYTRKKR